MKLLCSLFPLTTLCLCTVSSLASINTATAQIIPDNSLGAESSVVSPNVVDGVDRIDGGATRGSNLFHSFQEFNIDAGRGAYFSNPANIINILTRVTGGNPSNILGRLGVLGNANLFLINPKGIFFGPGASLDLRGGSFFGSTADSILFDNNFEFSASNPQPVPQLTINIPIGLRFRENPGSINSNANLDVQSGKFFALVGGDVSFNDGILTVPGVRVELGGLAQAGTIGINPDGSLSFPNGITRGDVRLSNGVRVGAIGQGGSIAVNARNLDISAGGGLFAVIPSNANPNAQAGDIVINATDKVRIEGDSNSQSNILNGSLADTGIAGDVVINTSILEGTGNFSIGSATSGQGNAGNVTITATDKVSLQGLTGFNGGINSLTGDSATGNAGNIVINTRSLSVSDSVVLGTSTLGQGNGGNIEINASDSVSLSGSNSFFTAIASSSGNAGNIIINTPSFSISNDAGINTSTSGQGSAGNIIINAANSVSVNSASSLLASTFSDGNAGNIIINAPNATVSFDGVGTSANTSINGESNISGVDVVGTGQGGDIEIKARSLSVTNGAILSTVTSGFTGENGLPNAGNIEVNASDFVNIDNAVLASRSFGEGNAGDINITGGSLSVTNGGQLLAETFNKGNAGNITINAPSGTVFFDGTDNEGFASSAFTTVRSGAVGKGGDISINARSLSLTNGGQLNTFVNGASDTEVGGIGNAGNVKLNISDTTQIIGKSNIPQSNDIFARSGINSDVESGATGNAGNIEITTGSLFIAAGSQLSSSTFGKGNAGNIIINAPTGTVSFDGTDNQGFPSGLFSTVEAGGEGKGGDITITARSLSLTNGGGLRTFVRGNSDTQPGGIGDAGNVKLNITDTINIAGISDTPNFTGNFNGSGIFSEVRDGAIGNAGNIEIATGSLFVTNGGEIISSTSGQGNAGYIKINANSFLLDAAQLNTNSDIENRQAGNIDITTTKDIRLNNGALISAETKGGQGNIFLRSRDLILRRNSNITTNATGTATGGNINIDTGNLVALENSDISANSQESFGGKVFIRADAIFGTQFRDQPTPESDITATGASPEFSGTVQIDTADVDPSQGLVELPENLADVSNQIAQNPCQKGTGSSFTITGRGGFPSSPDDGFSNNETRVDLVEPVASNSTQAATTNQSVKVTNTNKPIIPAQGWIFNSKGEVVLTAYDPTATSTAQRSSKSTAACPAF
ncbi:MAG: S-layer family protein [Pelatocladus maniniholoensis HA4357-MV3]|jgi:filamentous hemagglutinin family protein|uniref:S-layer family protein n=1 Tax=Pelatocladus maniniholoensis HA4357-MV3 TaxID=1117104 RepID=A0A9E3LSA8_9NOST|nr:S-layer family protein [Pelatocladus maniniholoensis HA4357-MV3]